MIAIALILSDIFWLCALPFLPIYLLVRVFKNKEDFYKLYHRFGFVNVKNSGKKMVYIHMASVGEVRSVFCMIDRLLLDNFAVHITIMTKTGYKIVHDNFRKRDGFSASFVPFDISVVIWFFLRRVKPCKVIFVQSEIWPQLLVLSKKFTKNNVYLVNAMMSKKSLKIWNFASKIDLNLLCYFRGIFVAEKEILSNIYKYNRNIRYLGSTKQDYIFLQSKFFNNNADFSDLYQDFQTILLASTHENEEELLLKSLVGADDFVNYRIIIAPRHKQRIGAVLKLVKSHNLEPILLTNFAKNPCKLGENQILIIDEMGELAMCYDAAKIVFIGGSLVDKIGGHNPLEPIFHKKPVIMGKYFTNCAESVTNLSGAKCLQILNNSTDIVNITREILQNYDQYLENIDAYLSKKTNVTTHVLAEIFSNH